MNNCQIKIHLSENNLKVNEITSFIQELNKDEKIRIVGTNEIQFKNYTGYFKDGEQKYLVLPQKICSYLDIDVDQPDDAQKKYDDFYLEYFDYILEKLSSHLVYQISPAEMDTEETNEPENEIYQLFLFLQKKEELLDSLNWIVNEPHRKLHEVTQIKRFDEIDHIDPDLILDIIENPARWQKHEKGIINKRYSPQYVFQYQAEESFDTSENRFIKYFLRETTELIEKLILRFQKYDSIIENTLKPLLDELEYLSSHSLFDEVKDLSYFPSNSQVLMKKTGYREVFAFYRMMNSGFKPAFFKNLDLSFQMKEMATLWEYYVLVKMITELETEFGKAELKIISETKQYESAIIFFRDNLIIEYQKSLKSYSNVEFRPDFYLEYKDKKIVFDAKFRIFDNNRQDILKNMHYYKDALGLDSSSAVCFPEQKDMINNIFFDINKNQLDNLKCFADVIHLEAKGVGFFECKLINTNQIME